ncbi:MAG: lipoprotein signal peptidase [Burkholderiales bacterium]|nr:lipoprotein signal peptidase [Burkholderiales bacterium]
MRRIRACAGGASRTCSAPASQGSTREQGIWAARSGDPRGRERGWPPAGWCSRSRDSEGRGRVTRERLDRAAARGAAASGAGPAARDTAGAKRASRSRLAAWLVLAVAVMLADQAAKHWMGSLLRPGEARALTGFFNLVLVFNPGAAFSFLSDASGWQRPLFVVIAVAAAALITWLLVRHAGESLFCLGLALILGGALGNLWDRVLLGHVVDFLDFHAFGRHFPAFNLADSAITCGAALLLYDGFRPSGRGPAGGGG